jgi:hypothetical protein
MGTSWTFYFKCQCILIFLAICQLMYSKVFHFNINVNLAKRIEYEVLASLIPKKMGNHPKFMWTLKSFVWKIDKIRDRPLTYLIGSKCWKL